jgi:hypothetical protein
MTIFFFRNHQCQTTLWNPQRGTQRSDSAPCRVGPTTSLVRPRLHAVVVKDKRDRTASPIVKFFTDAAHRQVEAVARHRRAPAAKSRSLPGFAPAHVDTLFHTPLARRRHTPFGRIVFSFRSSSLSHSVFGLGVCEGVRASASAVGKSRCLLDQRHRHQTATAAAAAAP